MRAAIRWAKTGPIRPKTGTIHPKTGAISGRHHHVLVGIGIEHYPQREVVVLRQREEPALQHAAQIAGVEVARELLGLDRANQATRAHAKPLGKGEVHQEIQGRPAAAPRARKPTPAGEFERQEIYRLDVASGRTSVSLPADLLVAARAAFGEPDLTKLVQQLYGQALSTKVFAANRAPNSGPVRKVNKSSLVREALARALAMRQAGSAGLGTFH